MKCAGRYLLALLVLTACAPALNWRQVPLDRITVLLPCKPDRAQRTLRLAESEVTISMAGCEADGTLFAVSHIHQPGVGAAASVARAWRTATLANMQASAVKEFSMTTVPGSVAATRLLVQGVRPDASTVQAHLAWLVAGDDVFHLAAYGTRMTPELADSLFSDIKIQ